MHEPITTPPSADGLSIGIAISRYHSDVTDALRSGAAETFAAAGGKLDDLRIVDAPGAFELPVICAALADRPDVDGVLALGCVIRGETQHDQYIAEAVAHGLTQIALDTGKPVAFGVLTCHTKHQARERASGEKGNKGAEAMTAVLGAIATLREITDEPVGGTEGRPDGRA